MSLEGGGARGGEGGVARHGRVTCDLGVLTCVFLYGQLRDGAAELRVHSGSVPTARAAPPLLPDLASPGCWSKEVKSGLSSYLLIRGSQLGWASSHGRDSALDSSQNWIRKGRYCRLYYGIVTGTQP